MTINTKLNVGDLFYSVWLGVKGTAHMVGPLAVKTIKFDGSTDMRSDITVVYIADDSSSTAYLEKYVFPTLDEAICEFKQLINK